ncbi:hypothetical protein ACFP1Z_11890 [Streptomyces gamaensis]|uniref:Secreted protein n=1 Tax=Streptomyces gamaensis TaxID=1763542 RepID=A0ABW0YYZ2_9ACTN
MSVSRTVLSATLAVAASAVVLGQAGTAMAAEHHHSAQSPAAATKTVESGLVTNVKDTVNSAAQSLSSGSGTTADSVLR